MAISPSGTWTYRSLLNNPDPNVPFNDLAFGVGTLVLEDDGAGGLSGPIGGDGWSLDIAGTNQDGALRLESKGVVGGEPWVYAYQGTLTPVWPSGKDQADTITGSVLRVVAHSHGRAPAGFVASFYAVRRI